VGRTQPRTAVLLSGAALAVALGLAPSPVVSQSGAVAAPTNLSFGGNTLRWTDNSDNEEGFRIIAEAFNGDRVRREYVVGANVTEFPVPSEVLPNCPDRPSARYQVVAFLGAVDSAVAEVGVIGECPPTVVASPPAATPQPAATSAPPVVALPPTGSPSAGRQRPWELTAVVVAFGTAALAALAVRALRRATR
jgi:hypothetical protein